MILSRTLEISPPGGELPPVTDDFTSCFIYFHGCGSQNRCQTVKTEVDQSRKAHEIGLLQGWIDRQSAPVRMRSSSDSD